jgi:hypothetical protein
VPDSTELKSELSKIVVSLGNLDPLRQLSDVASLPSFVHAIQPMLVCEALLRPASDLVKVFLEFWVHTKCKLCNIKAIKRC